MNLATVFIIAIIFPFVYWRILFYLIPKSFEHPFTRTRTKLQVHHLHLGVVMLTAGLIHLLFSDKNIYNIALSGLGLGLIIDDIPFSLLMPGNRPLELKIYHKSFKSTLILLLTISFLILFLNLAIK